MIQVWVEICTSHLKTDHNKSLKEECWNGWVLHIGVSPSFLALALGPRVGPAPYQGPLFSSSSLSKSLLESSIDRRILIEHVQNGELPSNETGCQDCEVASSSMPLCQPDFLQLPGNFSSWTSLISSFPRPICGASFAANFSVSSEWSLGVQFARALFATKISAGS